MLASTVEMSLRSLSHDPLVGNMISGIGPRWEANAKQEAGKSSRVDYVVSIEFFKLPGPQNS